MHRYITHAFVAAAAGVALTAVGVTGASASGAAPRAPRVARTSSAAASPAAASPGAQLWVKRYNGSNSTDDAVSVAASSDGKAVFVTGSSNGTTSFEDYATVGYNAATGAQLWVSRYNGPDNGVDEASSVAVSPDGKTVFVTGYSYGTTAGEVDYATVAYNAATGAQLWVKRYISPALQGFATSVAASPDGKAVFVTGYSASHTSGYDYATVAYNTITGAQLWVKRYTGPAGDDFAHSMTVSGSTVYVTGSSIGTNDGYDYATVAYNAATGAQLWAKRYNGAALGSRGANSVAASPDGKTVYVTGSSYAGSTTGYDYATVAYGAATGAQLWVKRFTGPGSGDDQAYSVAASPDGTTVFVTGYSSGTAAGQVDYATVGYNAATGAQLWVKLYAGLARGGIGTQAHSVAVSPSGSTVYVTGESGNDSVYATVAYTAATGAQLWVKQYTGNGPSGSAAQAVAVSPTTGTVFVTGYSSGSFKGNDYATVAYQG
jgi:WD40 repeat protein